MIDLNLLENQINEFIEISGDDISSVINLENVLLFSHTALVEKNFNYEVSLDANGVIRLLSQESTSEESELNQDLSGASAKTLMKEVVVKEGTANNIQDVIAFIYAAA